MFPGFNPAQFDPSKMDPKLMMELSQLIQTLPPATLNKMQSLMHNAMAGYDVRKDVEEFERNLPPDFREKMMRLMGQHLTTQGTSPVTAAPAAPLEASPAEPSSQAAGEMGLHQARLTVLEAVAAGNLSPAEAMKALFD